MNTSETNPSSQDNPELKKQNPEEMLSHVIALMESSLSSEGSADFKQFWEAREKCLLLFKENISPLVRAELWKKYRELTKQARLLKEHFEEESSFAVEQIEMAISALEKDVSDTSHVAEKFIFEKGFFASSALKSHREQYIKIQQELTLLNAHASRINALRKELTQTNMRMRKKGQLFERLSAIGDQVMPKRKELIQEISSLFIQDIEGFVQTHFSSKGPSMPLHACREEIKALQGVAKQLSINTKAFSESRMKLSSCWDKLKEKEKEFKKEIAEKKELFKTNAEEIRKKVEVFKEKLAAKSSTADELHNEIYLVTKHMRDVELGRDEVKALKEEIAIAKKPLLDWLDEEAHKKKQALQEKEEKKRAGIQAFEKEVQEFSTQLEQVDSAAILERVAQLRNQMKELSLSLIEKEKFSRSLTAFEERASDKAEEVDQLPDDPKAAIKALQKVIKSKQERKRAIKERIEKCRKAMGGSGLDFEQSLHFNEQIVIEKERYEKLGSEIQALEKQMAQFRS